MEISTSKYDIIESGSILIPDDDYVDFSFSDLRFRLFFESGYGEKSKDDASISGTIKSDNNGTYLQISVKNYNRPFATPTEILNVGTIDGRSLYFSFSVVPIGNEGENPKCRLVVYSWYKSKI